MLNGEMIFKEEMYKFCMYYKNVSSWLRHCTTNRKVAGSIPDGVTGIFQ
jgi:hypothetical protein